ncbi:MAG: shikimate kinase [Candidatus Krumholzibacteriota bacterium]|nr:shikimate kinase [Candidatus Krumholzibacteriota bacterium]
MRITLLGFMAAGKSTLGPILAGRAGLEFVDLDEAVAATRGRSVAELFARDGEAVFRRLEAEALAALAAREDLVLALGGGAVEVEQNHAYIRSSHGVYLRWPWPVLSRRLVGPGGDGRPLVEEGEAALRRRFKAREPLYIALSRQVLAMEEAGPGPGAQRRVLLRLADRILAAAGWRRGT